MYTKGTFSICKYYVDLHVPVVTIYRCLFVCIQHLLRDGSKQSREVTNVNTFKKNQACCHVWPVE